MKTVQLVCVSTCVSVLCIFFYQRLIPQSWLTGAKHIWRCYETTFYTRRWAHSQTNTHLFDPGSSRKATGVFVLVSCVIWLHMWVMCLSSRAHTSHCCLLCSVQKRGVKAVRRRRSRGKGRYMTTASAQSYRNIKSDISSNGVYFINPNW